MQREMEAGEKYLRLPLTCESLTVITNTGQNNSDSADAKTLGGLSRKFTDVQ